MSTATSSTAAPATPPAAPAVNRALNFFRWVLLVPLTFAIPTIVFIILTNISTGGFFSPHLFLRSFWFFFYGLYGLILLGTPWFIPAFLTVPTACVIAPSRQKKVSIIVLIVAALFGAMLWGAQFSPPPETSAETIEALRGLTKFHVVEICAQALGLFAGFAIVFVALKNREAGKPFPKKTAVVFAVILCAAIVFVVARRNSRIESGFEMSYCKTSEDHGMATCSFNMENKTDKELNLLIDLVAERRPDPIKPDNGIKVGSTQIAVSLAPRERKEFSKQFPIDTSTSATGHLVVYPSRFTSPLTKTDSP